MFAERLGTRMLLVAVRVGPRLGATDDGPPGLGRNVETDEGFLRLAVGLDDLEGGFLAAELVAEAFQFVLKDIGESLEEEERQQVVLELRRILLAANGAGRIPEHLLHRFGGENGAAPGTAAAAGRSHRRVKRRGNGND